MSGIEINNEAGNSGPVLHNNPRKSIPLFVEHVATTPTIISHVDQISGAVAGDVQPNPQDPIAVNVIEVRVSETKHLFVQDLQSSTNQPQPSHAATTTTTTTSIIKSESIREQNTPTVEKSIKFATEKDEVYDYEDYSETTASDTNGGGPGAMRELFSDIQPIDETQKRLDNQPQKTKRRTVNENGDVIYKGHKSYGLQASVQLAIRVAVGNITPRPARELTLEDFKVDSKMNFPVSGSDRTPPHNYGDFQFKDYSPIVFRHLRERFGIDAGNYMVSICGDQSLKEVSGSGKSGALFFFSHDAEYIIKTVTKKEAKFLREILPYYYNHVMSNPNTLITRFFGMHRIKPARGANVRFVVMNNVFDTDKEIHEVYDLKGSTVGRFASDKERRKKRPVLKDLDLNKYIYLGSELKAALLNQIKADCNFLKEMKIMDYSLLLGIHYRNRADPDFVGAPLKKGRRRTNALLTSSSSTPINNSGSVTSSTSAGFNNGNNSTTTNDANASSNNGRKVLTPRALGKQHQAITIVQRTAGPSVSIFQQDEGGIYGIDEVEQCEREEIYYVGIIDILQKWNVRKQLERLGKGITEDKDGISAVPPPQYAQRFREFAEKIMI